MINKDTKIYCSFSQKAGNKGCRFFNEAFAKSGLDAIYKSFSVKDIKAAVEAAKTLSVSGFAVSMPFKTSVIDYVDEISEEVDKIEAANTVINNHGHLKAHNTDYMAAKSVLFDHLGIELTSSCLPLYILGNGGYAKAVKYGAKSLGYKPINITRNNWGDIAAIRNSIIFNCTPVEGITVEESNRFIDCITSTETGLRLSKIQAAHQFKLYTDLELPE